MPDISMCTNEACVDKKQCYRYTATPSSWQSFMKFDGPSGDSPCSAFWQNDEKKTEDKNG